MPSQLGRALLLPLRRGLASAAARTAAPATEFGFNESEPYELRSVGVARKITAGDLGALSCSTLSKLDAQLKIFDGNRASMALVLLEADDGSDAASHGAGTEERIHAHAVINRLHELRTPSVGVLGSGRGTMAAHARFRVATEDTRFAARGVAEGSVPDLGLCHALSQLRMDGLGMYLALTGAELRGADAFWGGVASHFVPKAFVESMLPSRMSDVVSAFPESFEAKQPIREEQMRAVGFLLRDELHVEPPPCTLPVDAIKRCFGAGRASTVGGTLELLEKEAGNADSADSAWAGRVLVHLRAAPAASLELTAAHLRRSRGQPILESLRGEFRLAHRARALPSADEDVDAEAFFARLDEERLENMFRQVVGSPAVKKQEKKKQGNRGGGAGGTAAGGGGKGAPKRKRKPAAAKAAAKAPVKAPEPAGEKA